MTALAELFPPLALTVSAGPVMMRGISDEILPELCDLARRGIHDAGEMPFYFPWTDAPEADLARNTAAYHWRSRAEFSPGQWGLHLVVSRKVGYRPNGVHRLKRRAGELALNQGLVLTPARLRPGRAPGGGRRPGSRAGLRGSRLGPIGRPRSTSGRIIARVLHARALSPGRGSALRVT